MTAYFIRRFLLIIPTFIGITLAVFVVMQFVPGGPVERQIMRYQMGPMAAGGGTGGGTGVRGSNALPEEAIEQIVHSSKTYTSRLTHRSGSPSRDRAT